MPALLGPLDLLMQEVAPVTQRAVAGRCGGFVVVLVGAHGQDVAVATDLTGPKVPVATQALFSAAPRLSPEVGPVVRMIGEMAIASRDRLLAKAAANNEGIPAAAEPDDDAVDLDVMADAIAGDLDHFLTEHAADWTLDERRTALARALELLQRAWEVNLPPPPTTPEVGHG